MHAYLNFQVLVNLPPGVSANYLQAIIAQNVRNFVQQHVEVVRVGIEGVPREKLPIVLSNFAEVLDGQG